MVLQDVAILAIDQSIDTERNAPQLARTVTVAVTVSDSQLLAVAQQSGRLSLSLRGHDAESGGKARPVSADELNDTEAPAAAKPGKTIRLRKGTTVETVTVD